MSKNKRSADSDELAKRWWWLDPKNRAHIHEFSAAWEILRRTKSYKLIEGRVSRMRRRKDTDPIPTPGQVVRTLKDRNLNEIVSMWPSMISQGWHSNRNYLEIFNLCSSKKLSCMTVEVGTEKQQICFPKAVANFQWGPVIIPRQVKFETSKYFVLSVFKVKRKSSFSVEDIKDLPALVTNLKQQNDSVSKFLIEEFSNFTRSRLEDYDESTTDCEEMKVTLVEDMNRIIRGSTIYEKHRFRRVVLRNVTTQQLNGSKRSEERCRLNRLLLEDAYPLELSRNQITDITGGSMIRDEDIPDLIPYGHDSMTMIGVWFDLRLPDKARSRAFDLIWDKRFPKMGSRPFLISDIQNIQTLVTKLIEKRHPVSRFLYEELSDFMQSKMMNNSDRIYDKTALQESLIIDLNKIIKDSEIYEYERFEDIELRPETKKLVGESLKGAELARLNRLLLEDAFPLELSKYPRKDKIPQIWKDAMDASYPEYQCRKESQILACPQSPGKCVAMTPAFSPVSTGYKLLRSLISRPFSEKMREVFRMEWTRTEAKLLKKHAPKQTSIKRNYDWMARREVERLMRPINKAFLQRPIIAKDSLMHLAAYDCGPEKSLQREILREISKKEFPLAKKKFFDRDFNKFFDRGSDLIEQIDQVFYRKI